MVRQSNTGVCMGSCLSYESFCGFYVLNKLSKQHSSITIYVGMHCLQVLIVVFGHPRLPRLNLLKLY